MSSKNRSIHTQKNPILMGNKDMEKHNQIQNQNHGSYPEQPYYLRSTERLRTSWLIPLIVIADIAIFIVVMFVNNCPKNGFDGCFARFLGPVSFQPLRENPLLGPSSKTLLKMGALEWDKVVHQHEGWRLVTCIWLHAGLVHLLADMLCLVLIGIRLEQQFGFLRVGPLYLVSGIGGSILSSLFLQTSISVGSSGALFGLLGAMLAELFTNWTIHENKAAAVFSLLLIVAVNLAIGIIPRVDNFAHIGGFVTGFFLGFILLMRPRYGWQERNEVAEHARVKSKYLAYQLFFFGFACLVLIAGFTFAAVMLVKGKNGNDHCKWCHYLSCVPTSKWDCSNQG